MKHQMDKKHSYIDAAFFRFAWKLLLKKTSLYVAVFAYFILVLTFSLVVPMLSGSNPITIISNPIMSMFLLFGMAVVSCFIAIEIFRTSIDDGTELLVVSKPLSRREIVFVKLTVFIVSILVVSLLTGAIGATSFISTNSYVNDNINIVIGFFVGSFVVGMIFGSLATIISVYAKKVIAMLLTIAIAFALMVYSLLSSFVIDNPVNVLDKNDEKIAPVSIVNFEKSGNELSKNMTLTQGVVSADEDGRSPQEVWESAKSKSSYKIAGMVDLGAQLGSIFSLTTPPKDSMQALSNLSAFNSPIDMTFSSYDIDNNNQEGITLRLPKLELDQFKDDPFFNAYNQYGRDLAKMVAITNQSSSLRTPNALWNSSLDYSYGDFIKTNIQDKLWKDTWNKEIDVYKTDANGDPTDVKLTLGEWVNQKVANEINIYHKAKELGISNNYNDPKYDWLPGYFDRSNNSKEIGEYIRDKSKIDNITRPSSFFIDGYARYVYKLNSNNINGFVREFNNVMFSALYSYSMSNTNNYEIDVMNIFDIQNDIDKDVIIGDVLPDQTIITSKDKYNKIGDTIKAIYKQITNEDLTNTTKISDAITKLSDNDADIKSTLENKAKTRNEYRTILELNGIAFPQVLSDKNLKLDNYIDFTKELPATLDATTIGQWSEIIKLNNLQSLAKQINGINFRYYIGTNEEYDAFNSITSDYQKYQEEYEKKYWSFSFYPSLKLAPTNLISSFQQIFAYSLIDRNILIPVWAGISILMFAIGMVLYSKRDFA